MLPFSDETITVYHKQKYKDSGGKTRTEWDRRIISGCSWRNTINKSTIGDIAVQGSNTTVCIPDSCSISVGDVVVRGEVYDMPDSDEIISPILSKYAGRVITVKAVTDNIGRLLAHTEVTG